MRISFLLACFFCVMTLGCKSELPKETLVLHLGAEPSNLNPLLTIDTASSSVTDLVFSSFFRVNSDLALEPELLEKYHISEDGKVYTFYLKKNVRFHDGHPLTAEDVKFTYDKILDPKTNTVRRSNFIIDQKPVRFEVVDDYTLKAYLPKPFSPFLVQCNMGILPKHLLEKEDINKTAFNRHPIGSGPFKFVNWESNQYVTLSRFDEFFLEKPKLKDIILKIIPDQNTAQIALENAELDEASIMGKDVYRYEKHPLFNIYRYYGLVYVYMGFNLKHPYLKDLLVRKAIAHAVNKKGLIDGVLKGFGLPADIPSVPALWSYPKKEAITSYGYNPQESKRLLTEAGFLWNKKTGFFEKNGRPFEFTLLTNKGNKDREKAAEVIQQYLKQVGIKMNIQLMEWSALLKVLNQPKDPKSFDAALLGWSVGIEPDSYAIWHSSEYPKGFNFIGYQNSVVDQELVLAREEVNQEKRKVHYQKIYQEISKDMPYLFLFFPETLQGINRRVKGLSKPGPAGMMTKIESIYVTP